MLCEVWYVRLHKKKALKPKFLKLNKPHVMQLRRIEKIEKWFFNRYGYYLDISFKKLVKPKNVDK
jgi:hypothetical protein